MVFTKSFTKILVRSQTFCLFTKKNDNFYTKKVWVICYIELTKFKSNLSLKYQTFLSSGCFYIGIRQIEFKAQIQLGNYLSNWFLNSY